MLISEKKDMIFQTEFLIRSIKKFSGFRSTQFSVVVNGDVRTAIVEPSLTKGSVDNRYVMRNADVWRSPYFWSIPIPHRWYIEPKSETCVMIDVDMIACKDISPIFNLDKKVFYGVNAYKKFFSLEDWRKVGVEKVNYFNFGLLIVPSEKMRIIGESLLNNVKIVTENYKNYYYFAAQIALTKTLYELQLDVEALPREFNWYDMRKEENLNDIIFLHYMSNRKYVKDKNIMIGKNGYLNLINSVAAQVFVEPKLFL